MSVLVAILFILFPSPILADIFVPSTPDNSALKDTLANDRSGYYYHSPGVDAARAGKKVSDVKSFPSGALTRDRGLYDFDTSFDEAFSKEGSFDRYKAVRNNLLLLSYASPALADVIKHYRVMTSQRIALEQRRLADIEQAANDPLDRLRMASERECLKERQGEGLVKAMERCKQSAEPFDGLRLLNGAGALSDGRRNIHVVRDAVALLGLSEKASAEKTAVLSGDVVISDNTYTEVLAKETFEGRAEHYRKQYARKWEDVIRSFQGDNKKGSLLPVTLAELSLPGVPVTEMIARALGVLDAPSRAGAAAKLSAYLARAETQRDYEEAMLYIDHAQRLPQLPQEFRQILRARYEFLNNVLARFKGDINVSEGYRSMLANLLTDADTARSVLLKNDQPAMPQVATKEELMLDF